MKKILFTTLVLFSIGIFAQEENITSSELKLNVGYALGEIPEISYEYLLNEDAAIGTSILFAITDDTDLKFALTPYYRWYFGKKRAAGFFAETFGMLNVVEDNDYIIYDSSSHNNFNSSTETGFALGISVGAKFLSKNNWVFELYLGVGRNIINSDGIDGVPRAGLTLGKRF